MKQELTLEEIKMLQLNMLKKIDCFCRNNNIEYSISYGTLIWAIRHGGYIPWDDDIDIIMTRQNYDNFILAFGNNVCDNMKLLSFKNNFFGWVKIVDFRTELIEKINYDIKDYGVWIDIFPIDVFPEPTTASMKIFFLILKIIKKVSKIRARSFNYINTMEGGFLKKFGFIILKLLLTPVRVSFFGNLINTILKTFQNSNYSYAGNLSDDTRAAELMDKTIFNNYCNTVFEGVTVRMIVEYDIYLTRIYDDYMQLPPIEKRVSNHNFRAYWKNK